MFGIYYPDTLYGTIYAIPCILLIYGTIRNIWWYPYAKHKYFWRKCDGCQYCKFAWHNVICTYDHNERFGFVNNSKRAIGCKHFEKRNNLDKYLRHIERDLDHIRDIKAYTASYTDQRRDT